MKKPIKKLVKALTAILAVSALCFQLFALTGCSLLAFLFSTDYVGFTRSSLTLYVGDTYDLAEIIESDYGSYELSVSPSSLASLSGTNITALKAGSGTVTVESQTDYDTLALTVKERMPSTLSIETDGKLLQSIDSISDVVFIPKATGETSGGIEWAVNGTKKDTLSASTPYTFTPSAVGSYVITASMDNLSASETVSVFYPVAASCSYSGETNQDAPYTPVSFTATAEENPLNPENVFEWFVDGVKVNTVNESAFTYMPTAGTHTVTLKVNGMTVDIENREYLTIVCYGSIVPSTPTIEFDNLYPHVYLNHDAQGAVCVEITPQGESAQEYSQTDSRYARLFEDGRVDVGELISLCASGTTRKVYGFRVKSLGDGGALRESAYSDTLSFTQLAKEAAAYISSLYYDRDYYITSDEEYVNILEYKIISRTKTVNARVSFDVYIGYNLSGSAKDLWNEAFPIAATSGSYTSISVNMTNKVMSTSFKVDTVNSPTRQTRDSNRDTAYSTQLHAIVPHINFDEDKYRPSSYVFHIDALEKTQSVTYTDELYLAAQNNTRPIPTSGSAAETVYNLARDVLRKICTDDMTDAQKAHAIYDWIMWQVTYDTPATTYRGTSETLSAYYLEGVFGDGKTPIGGVVYKPYAVCDGMSKAYSLLCNMEGIPCVRVPGLAGSSLGSAGGHAWNKVFIDGQWYIVDCTWGDVTGTLTIGNKTGDYELGIHDHLFITDEMVEGNHFEPYQSGETNIVYTPSTAANPYPVYSEYVYNGVPINCEILDFEDAKSRLSTIAKSFARAYTSRSSIKVPGYGNGVYTLTYEGIEVHFRSGVTLSTSSISSTVTSAIRTLLPRADVRVLAYGNTVIILIDN
ncbi:MAG: hypothetical protein J1F33_02325 [Clostridiales bacterium]|nr:hypothetical protein [Clostridiales bacterium]